MSTETSPATAMAIAPVRRRCGRWRKIPKSLFCGVFALTAVTAALARDKPKGAPPPVTEATAEKEPPSRHKSFEQRPCKGIDDCTRANIEAEQTEASRAFNRTARESIARAVRQLGPPTFVLRSGDKVGMVEYDRNPTEMRLADAIVGWANGHCSPNELHVVKSSGRLVVSPMPGGTLCTTDGSPYPLPGRTYSCAAGRKRDALCTLAGILKLPEIQGDNPAPADASPHFNAGRHFGYLAWASENCAGQPSAPFKSAMAMARKASPSQFDSGVAEGIAAMKRAAAKSDVQTACLTILFLYGPSGQNIPNAWQSARR